MTTTEVVAFIVPVATALGVAVIYVKLDRMVNSVENRLTSIEQWIVPKVKQEAPVTLPDEPEPISPVVAPKTEKAAVSGEIKEAAAAATRAIGEIAKEAEVIKAGTKLIDEKVDTIIEIDEANKE